MKTNTTEPLTLLSHGSLEALYSEAGPDLLCTGHFLAWLTKVTGGGVTCPRLHKGVGFLGYISLPGLPGFWLSSHRAPAVHTEQHQGKSLVMEARAVTWKPSGCLEGDTFCILIASNHLLASRCCFSNRGCCTTSTFSCSPKPQKPRGEALRTHVRGNGGLPRHFKRCFSKRRNWSIGEPKKVPYFQNLSRTKTNTHL